MGHFCVEFSQTLGGNHPPPDCWNWGAVPLPGGQAAFDKCQYRAHHFAGVCASPYKSTWATLLHHGLYCRTQRGSDGSHPSSLTDDYQFELRDQAQLRRRQRRRPSRQAAERQAEGTPGASNPRALDSHTLTSIWRIAMRAPLTLGFRVCPLGAQQAAIDRVHFCVRLFGGVFISRTNLRIPPPLCTLGPR